MHAVVHAISSCLPDQVRATLSAHRHLLSCPLDSLGRSPLHLAIDHGREDLIPLLVDEFQADPQAEDYLGLTPSHHLALRDDMRGVREWARVHPTFPLDKAGD